MTRFQRFVLFNFRWVYRQSRWFERRFTPAGRFLAGSTVLTGALGIDTRVTLAYQLGTFGAGLLLVALFFAPFFRRARFEAERRLPRYGTVGQPLLYKVCITSLHPTRMERGLDLRDELVGEADPAGFFRAHEPGEGAQNWFDRKVGYPRWVWFLRQAAGGDDPERELPDLPPRHAVEVEMRLTPLRRGFLRLDALIVRRPDPLGLFCGLRRIERRDRLLVLPRRYPLPDLPLPGGRRDQRGDLAQAPRLGDSSEFISLRNYRPGDPLRHIHWKSLAKTGQPVVKEFQEEFAVRHALILDTFTALDADPAFEEAVSVAASFAARLDTRESLLDLLFAGAEVYCHTSGHHTAPGDYLLSVLACVGPARGRSFADLTAAVLAHAGLVSGCVCILLAWDEARRALVDGLRARGTPCVVLVISDAPTEGAPVLWLHPGRVEEGLRRLGIGQ